MTPDINALWRELEALERRLRAPAPHDAHHGADWFDDWRVRLDRVRRVRGALFLSGPIAQRLVAERLSGIDLSGVGEILLSACKDVAVVWGGSVVLGGAAGGAIGFFGFGVGAVPGAVVGAGVGTQVGAWVLGLLGLKALIEDLGTAIPDALHHYETGFKLAWGPVRRWEADQGTDRAPYELAEGHIVLMIAMLSALTAYLTRGRGDPGAKARILQEIRESPRLGSKVADWVVANESQLIRHPSIRPREQQVSMSASGRPSVGPPVTPSQMRPAAGKAGGESPPPKKPEQPAAPKAMPQKKVRCFEPNDLPQDRYDEFDRQLKGQEDGLNDMTVDEYLQGRDAFDADNRDTAVARKARAQHQKKLATKLADDLLKEGKGKVTPKDAKAQAAVMAAEKMKTLAALHNPDLYAGGKDVIADFGDRGINSRIGAQWKTKERIAGLDEAARRVPTGERGSTKMNAKLERCK